MEKVAKEKRARLAKLTKDAPEDFAVAEFPEMEKIQSHQDKI